MHFHGKRITSIEVSRQALHGKAAVDGRAVEFSTDTDEFEGEVEVESGAVAGVFDVVDA
jgi:hypothetical protein